MVLLPSISLIRVWQWPLTGQIVRTLTLPPVLTAERALWRPLRRLREGVGELQAAN